MGRFSTCGSARSLVLRLVLASSLLLVSCSGDDESAPPSSDAVTSTVTESEDPFSRPSTSPPTTDEMRPVPSPPDSPAPDSSPPDSSAPSDLPAGGGSSSDDTATPSGSPTTTPSGDDTGSSTPSTALVGDPQPTPGTTGFTPPPTVAPPPDACTRLDDVGVVQVVADAVAAADLDAVTVVLVDDSTCRLESGAVVVEVGFVSLAEVRDDWYRRSGIEPVGEVGGDAVGFGSFVAPSGARAEGYTIAIAGGRDGVIVAVTGTPDARSIAADVTVFANQAA